MLNSGVAQRAFGISQQRLGDLGPSVMSYEDRGGKAGMVEGTEVEA